MKYRTGNGTAPWISCLLFAVLLLACDRPPMPGASRIAKDTYWRLHTLGEEELKPAPEDSVLVRVRIARPGEMPGSLFSTERWYAMKAAGTSFFFGRLCPGDSASVWLPATGVPWQALGVPPEMDTVNAGPVQMELALLQVRTPAGSAQLMQQALMARNESDEQRILSSFFGKDEWPWKQAMGIWYRLEADPGGPKVQSGETVTLIWTARFLDSGVIFDEQTEKEGGLTFRLGDPGQVIMGLEAACHLLPARGGTGEFIIPSSLAFGPRGSSSGIVPPWTPVLYRVQVLPQRGA